MKQFQFEVKNLNYLRRELARIKRFCSNEEFNSVFFQIFTQCADYKEIKEITNIIESDFPFAEYYGFQTYGNICEGKLGLQKTMIVCYVFELESTRTKLIYIDPSKRTSKFKSLDDLWEYVNKEKWVKGVKLLASLNASKKYIQEGPLENLRPDVKIFGGVACHPNVISEMNNFIFSKGQGKSDKAIIAVLIGGDDFHLDCGYISGWEALGKNFTITKSDDNSILEIDDKPAFDIYRKYLHIEQDENFGINGSMFPLLIEQNGVECIRIPFNAPNKNHIYFGRSFEEGSKVRLSYGDKPTILKHIRNKFNDIASFSPESINFFSCAIRRTFWGDDKISKETELFDTIAPTIGCYTHGEILSINNYLHRMNATMVYVLMREGKPYELDYSLDDVLDESENENTLAPKLISYISAVTSELEGQFNKTLLGLASIYKSMFLINLEKETITQIDKDTRAKKLLSESKGFSEKMNYFLSNVITPETLQTALDFCNFDTLVNRMKDKNFIDCEIKGRTIGWARAQFVVINRDDNGVPFEFVFSTQGIDAQKKERDEQQKIIQTLADTYNTLHLFDLKQDTCEEVSSNEIIHSLMEKYKGSGNQALMNSVMTKMVNEKYLNSVLDFINFNTIEKRMNISKMISVDFLGNVNGWTKASFIDYERDEKNRLSKVLFTTQIIDEAKRYEERLEKKSRTDGLTELSNRSAYEEAIKELEAHFRNNEICFYSIDVNGLKDANDELGHEAGDELLIGAANCIKLCFGTCGTVYRTGGDEFAVIFKGNKKTAEELSEKFTKYVSQWKGRLNEKLSLSFGYAVSTEKCIHNIKELQNIADKRMYEMKENYYRLHKGVDRRNQNGAFEIIYESYFKILKGNLSEDSFEIIKNTSKNKPETFSINQSLKLSEYLKSLVQEEKILPDDIQAFLEKTDINVITDFFRNNKKSYHLVYRNKVENEVRTNVMVFIPAKSFSTENMEVYLFIKDICF